MGSSQSTRRLTISNEEEAGVIKVSNSLIQRLSNANKEFTTTVEPVKEVSSSPPAIQTPSQPAPVPSPLPPRSRQVDAGDYPVYYCTDLTQSALQIQQQKNQEIQKLDKHWQKHLESLEKDYSAAKNIMEEEYQKALKEYKSGKRTVNIGQAKQPCKENSMKVLQCYEAHPKEILKCSPFVEEFSKCVDHCRANVIDTHC